MSRAAKRRSKKRQKNLKPQKDHDDNEATDDKESSPMLVTTTTHPLPPRKKPKTTTIHAQRNERDDEDSEQEDEIQSMGDSDEEEAPPLPKKPVQRNTTSSTHEQTSTRAPPGISRLVQLLCDDADQGKEWTSEDRAKYLLSFLLNMPLEEFYKEYFEKKPLLVQNQTMKHKNRLDGLLNLAAIQTMVQTKELVYGQDLNVTRYELQKDGVKRRTTLDPTTTGKNDPSQKKRVDSSLWSDYYHQGCTIRLLCPQKHNDVIYSLLSHLETEFGCMIGSNAYLTPPDGSQGFAPHYDDIDAFCLQLEGKKRWKVYAPMTKAERLPRVSSEDYTAADLNGVDPVMDVVLEPGDVLYMPRGWIHQACTLPEPESVDANQQQQQQQQQLHSLHLTISAMQQWAWIDLLEIAVPEALQAVATGDSVVLREGLPSNFLNYMGAMHDSSDDTVPEILKNKLDDSVDSVTEAKKMKKEEFLAQAKRRIALVAKEAMNMMDAACDQLGVRFLSERLPPALSEQEKAQTDAGRASSLKLLPDMMCRLVRPGIARLLIEDGKAVLYHCNDNSRVFMERPLNPLEFELDDAPAIEQLLTTVEPRWIMLADLFHDTLEDKVAVAQALYDEGLLSVHSPSERDEP